MPYNVINPDYPVDMSTSLAGANYSYDYPDGLNLKPGSDLHQKILTRLNQYAFASSVVIRERHNSWNEIDNKLRAFIPTSEAEKRVQKKDPRRPVSIVFPYTYAILETLVAYMVSAFTPEPIFRYEGVSPSDVAGSILLERLINVHCQRNKAAVNLHTFFRDAGAYGFGAVSPYWEVKTGIRDIRSPIYSFDSSGNRSVIDYERLTREQIIFEGNALQNIDPYFYLPDPNVPINDVQKGEFVGWLDTDNFMNLLSEEQTDDSMFNVRYLRHMGKRYSAVFGRDKGQKRRRLSATRVTSNQHAIIDPLDILNMYVKLIPKDWNIGSSDVPEKWLFTVAADSVIIRMKPLQLNHNMFPVCLAAPDFDGYSPVAYSRLEILSGMQVVIDWLFNSHIANVRKAINDVLIVDPYLLNINDLREPGAGGIVRLRRPAWGRGVENAVMQLAITDITQRNLQDVAYVIQYMQQISGIDNPTMGALRSGGPERLTASEYQGTARGAISRLERVAKITGSQGMQDIGYMFAYNAQQLMSEATWVRTIGEWPDVIKAQFDIQDNRVRITPFDILVDYDLLIRDGSIPGGNFSDNWVQIFQAVSSNPALMQRIDVFRLFKYIATQLGAKNVDDFEIRPQVQPDEVVMNEVQNGNLVAVEELQNYAVQ
jgi:hypothetical protein